MPTEPPLDTLRIFAAIRPSKAVLDPLQEWWDSARKLLPETGWRAMPVENWHVTLAFYGETATETIPDLRRRLDKIAGETAPFGIELRGFGVFPDTDRARIFWAGAFGIDPPEALARLAHRCMNAIGQGPEPDPRKAPKTYRGHISLARAKGRRQIDLAPFVKNPPPVLSERVDCITLYRSELAPKGSRYTPIERFALRG